MTQDPIQLKIPSSCLRLQNTVFGVEDDESISYARGKSIKKESPIFLSSCISRSRRSWAGSELSRSPWISCVTDFWVSWVSRILQNHWFLEDFEGISKGFWDLGDPFLIDFFCPVGDGSSEWAPKRGSEAWIRFQSFIEGYGQVPSRCIFLIKINDLEQIFDSTQLAPSIRLSLSQLHRLGSAPSQPAPSQLSSCVAEVKSVPARFFSFPNA